MESQRTAFFPDNSTRLQILVVSMLRCCEILTEHNILIGKMCICKAASFR